MLLPLAVICVILALISYTVSIWYERLKNKMPNKMLYLLWIGFFFDALGTLFMILISEGFKLDMHSYTGFAALFLMLIKALITTSTRNMENKGFLLKNYGVVFWLYWVFVFVSGAQAVR